MENLIDRLTTLGVVLLFWAICYVVRLFAGFKNVRKQMKNWNWAQFRDGLFDRFCWLIATGGAVVACEMLKWLMPSIGITFSDEITLLLDTASVIAIPFVNGVADLVLGIKSIQSSAGWNNNVKSVGADISGLDVDYDKIAGDIREFAETITGMTSKEDIESDAVAPPSILEYVGLSAIEAGRGGILDTYPEPYRSAVQDTITDPSTCWNREAQPAGTLITLESGAYKAVEDIRVGDRLWNHDGTEIVTVKSLWKEKKPVYTIRTGLGDIRFTGEHPLYTRRNKWQALAKGNLKAFSDPTFVKAKDLRVGDKILAPELEGEILPLSDNELRWLGFYLGDGTKSVKSVDCPVYRLIVPDGRKRSYVDGLEIAGNYSVHSHTKKAKYFNLAKKQAPELRKILDEIDGKSFSRLVTPEQAELIVEGYLAADGCHLYGDVYSASSTDKKLLLAIQRMVLSIGGTMSIHKRYDEGELEKFGTTVYAKTLWDANINLRPKKQQIHRFKDGKYATITKIELGEEEEEVYNIEVSGSHTYIADNHGVHNCVSYCAWKIYEATGKWPTRTGSMNAKEWVARLTENGYKQVAKPVTGGKYLGVTTAGVYGHVVWYEGDQTISEYNYVTRGAFSVRSINLSAYTWMEIVPASHIEPSIPTEVPKPQKGKVSYTYQQGDTFGEVITRLGLKTSHGLWGEDGDVAYYTNQLHDQGIWGNVPLGKTIYLTPRK